jgi:hypothetical protein
VTLRVNRDVVTEILSEVRGRWVCDQKVFQKHGDLGCVDPATHVLDLAAAVGRVSTELFESSVDPTSALAYIHHGSLRHYRDALLDVAAYACAAIDEMDQGAEDFG